MSKVDISLFGRFRIELDGREIPLESSVKELIALLAVAAGHRVTAKGLWRILYGYKGIKYSALFFTTRVNDLKSELEDFHLSEMVAFSNVGVRSCRLNTDDVRCDYYEMLDGKREFAEETDFLPKYEWAKAFYHKKWDELFDYWDSINV